MEGLHENKTKNEKKEKREEWDLKRELVTSKEEKRK